MKKFLLILPILLLTGCAHSLNVTTDPVKRATLNIPTPPPLKMDNVQWIVVVTNDKPNYSLRGFDT